MVCEMSAHVSSKGSTIWMCDVARETGGDD